MDPGSGRPVLRGPGDRDPHERQPVRRDRQLAVPQRGAGRAIHHERRLPGIRRAPSPSGARPDLGLQRRRPALPDPGDIRPDHGRHQHAPVAGVRRLDREPDGAPGILPPRGDGRRFRGLPGESVIMPEFSVRLDSAVSQLRNLGVAASAEKQRFSISERLHGDMLARLRGVLGRALSAKARVALLVDNLDKAWNQHTDLKILSELLFGLLSVSARVAEEFAKDGSWREAVNLSLTIFLRSDIYAAMIRFARERDKLPIRRMT